MLAKEKGGEATNEVKSSLRGKKDCLRVRGKIRERIKCAWMNSTVFFHKVMSTVTPR